MALRSNRCKIFLKSLGFSHLILRALIPIGMIVLLFFTRTWAQSKTESCRSQLILARLNMTPLTPYPNTARNRTGQSEYQIRLLPSNPYPGSIPGRQLVAKRIDPWLGKDKADHFIVSAFIAGTCYYLGRTELQHSHGTAVIFSFSSSGGIGLAKEVYDSLSKRGTASWKDLLADFLGTGIGILLLSN